MKDKSTIKLKTTYLRKENEMLIYEAEGINLVDVYYLIQAQIATINNQAKVIKLLEENNKLKDKVRKLSDECDQLEDALHRHPDDY